MDRSLKRTILSQRAERWVAAKEIGESDPKDLSSHATMKKDFICAEPIGNGAGINDVGRQIRVRVDLRWLVIGSKSVPNRARSLPNSRSES